jgi:hypothetical protein
MTVMMKAPFINIDLEVRSRRSLAPLLAEWPWAQTPTRKGTEAPRFLTFSDRSNSRTADRTVLALVDLVEALPRRARRSWDQATSRTFDIGMQASDGPRSLAIPLGPQAVQAIARVSGRINVTVYPARPELRGGRRLHGV